jgi:phage-related protein
MPYEVEILQSALDFIDGLPGKMRAKALRSINLLREFGPFLREPHSKPVVGWKGLMELRVKFASDICRLFYFWHPDARYFVVSGYIKKSMKLNRNELQKAFKMMKEALKAKGESDEDL